MATVRPVGGVGFLDEQPRLALQPLDGRSVAPPALAAVEEALDGRRRGDDHAESHREGAPFGAGIGGDQRGQDRREHDRRDAERVVD